MKKINNFLEKKATIYTYGTPREAIIQLGIPFLTQFHKQRVKKKIWMLHIYNEDAKDRVGFLNRLKFTGAKYLPKEYNTFATTRVCGDEVVITHYTRPPLTIQICNKELAEAYKKYFKLLWKLAAPKDLRIKSLDLGKLK